MGNETSLFRAERYLMAKKKKNQRSAFVKAIKKSAREAELARNKIVGKPRAKTFGGLKTAKERRQTDKIRLKRLDGEENGR